MHLTTVTMSLEVRPRQHRAKSGNFWRRKDSEEVGTAGYPNEGTAAAEDRASVKMAVFSFSFCLLTASSRTLDTVTAEQNPDQCTYAHSTLSSSTSDFST